MIYTLNARDNVILQVYEEISDLKEEKFSKLIESEIDELKKKLIMKRIEYSDLKNALIPVHKDKKEFALIFDTTLISDSFYGYVIFNSLLPLLCKSSTNSILCGDLFPFNLPIEVCREIIFENTVQVNETSFKHPTQYHVIYINNSSVTQMTFIIKELKKLDFFIGYSDMTFSSRFKTLLANTLVPKMIKNKNVIILSHEEDIDDSENINNTSFDFESHGFEYKSINSLYYYLFLSYKIESLFADQVDLTYGMRAIKSNISNILDLSIRVSNEKLLYLNQKKHEVLFNLGLIDYTNEDLQELIFNSIKKGYFYNLHFLEEYNVPKFNVSLELMTTDGKKRKALVSLKYSETDNLFEFITMY